jgi:hypothetical protein
MQKKSNSKTTGNGGPQPSAAGTKLSPTQDDVARRAYELYVARGRVPGHELEDWIQAELELSGKARG